MIDSKQCIKCNKVKPLAEFYKNTGCKDGCVGQCKACQREASSKYRAEHREHYRKCALRYNAAHRTQQADSKLQRNYGITLDDYDAMLEAQDGGCAICGRTPAGEGRRLNVDHDHKTGKVRGLLCSDCNRALGGFQDSPALLRSAANYLEGRLARERL